MLTMTSTGCVLETGTAKRQTDEFMRGRGATVHINYEKQRRQGELIGFRADTAFVLAHQKLYAIASRLLYARNNEVSTFSGSPRMTSRHARYPIGVTTELEAQLLARLGQSATLR